MRGHHPVFWTGYYIKQILLVLSMVYFYWLSFALTFHKPTHGLDDVRLFLIMLGIFVGGLAVEGLLQWWHKRFKIFLWIMIAAVYALLGLWLAPHLYGSWLLPYTLLFPLAAVFVGGWVWALGSIIHHMLSPHMILSIDDMQHELATLPGWQYLAFGLEKTFHFSSFGEALAFVARSGVVAQKHHHLPAIDIREQKIKFRLTSPGEGGVTRHDLDMARAIDEL